MIRTFVFVACYWACSQALAADDAIPLLVRVFIVDDSASMSGNRINVVKDEMGRILGQLAPSADYPVVLVTFGTVARAPQVYTRLRDAQTAIGRLSGDSGGTNIAAGLSAATAAIASLKNAPHVCVLLYTDGEDSNTAGILAEEARLDALFGQRKQQGLHNTIVFCKRWENANAILKAHIEKRGSAQVIDAGEADMVPITIRPAITVQHAQWVSSPALQLQVKLTASLQVRGDTQQSIAPLELRSVTPLVQGGPAWSLVANSPAPQTLDVMLLVPAADLASGSTTLSFQLKPPPVNQIGKTVFVPLLTAQTLRVAVSLPRRVLRNLLSARLEMPGAGVWVDPFTLQVRYDGVVHLDVNPAEAIPGDRWAKVRVLPDGAVQLKSSQTALAVPRPGRYEVPVSVEMSPVSTTGSFADTRLECGLILKVEQAASGVEFSPSQVKLLRTGLLLPPSVTTTIIPAKVLVRSVVWSDVAQGLATIEADCPIEVQGPIPAGTQVNLLAPSVVAEIECLPSVLRTGQQSVRLKLVAKVQSPQRALRLNVSLVPPSQKGAVSFRCDKPVVIECAPPPPLRLVTQAWGGSLQALRAVCDDNQDRAHFEIIPRLIGAPVPMSGDCAFTACLRCGDRSLQLEPQSVGGPLNRPLQFDVTLPSTGSSNFFHDSVVNGTVDLAPAVASPAVMGSRYPTQIVIRAPFKRLALRLAIGLSSLLAVVVILRTVVRLRTQE